MSFQNIAALAALNFFETYLKYKSWRLSPQKGLLCLLCCPFLSPQHTFLITSPSGPEFITKLFLHNTADWNFLNRNWNFLSYIAFSRELFRAFLHSATVDWNFLKRKPCESKLWMKIIPYSNLSSTLLLHSQITLHVFDFCQYFFRSSLKDLLGGPTLIPRVKTTISSLNIVKVKAYFR